MKDYLSQRGWKERNGFMVRDLKDWDDKPYRIAWEIGSHILHLGYGLAPFKVESITRLCQILGALGYDGEVYELLKVIGQPEADVTA